MKNRLLLLVLIGSLLLFFGFYGCGGKKTQSEQATPYQYRQPHQYQQKSAQVAPKESRQPYKYQQESTQTALEPDPKELAKKKLQEELEQKMRDIEQLQKKIAAKKTDVDNTIIALNQEITELNKELLKMSSSELQQGPKNYKVRCSLLLIQQKTAYVKKLSKIYHGLVQGEQELIFLYKKTETDLRVAKALDQEEVTHLIEEIDRIISQYLPYTNKTVINTEDVRVDSLNKLWRDLELEKKAEEKKIEEMKEVARERLRKIKEGTFFKD